ncbi:MAG: histidine--tRNA ligase [Patescibacteria group bacterium]|nr:MAG: histidine--tRNA ligase [Patescibacteria group bacterium]
MINPRKPAGFHEFLPPEQLSFDAMVAVIKASYESHGYTPIETPALELAEVLHAKEGGETAKQGYQFTKGDTKLALRFDLTVPLARYVAEHYHDLALPFRRYQIQNVWRAEKPQAGRYRQFYQCDIDIIGTDSATADADILITMNGTMQALGLEKSLIRLNNRLLMSGLIIALKAEKNNTEILRLLDKMDSQGPAKLKKSLINIGLNKKQADTLVKLAGLKGSIEQITKALKSEDLYNTNIDEGLGRLRRICELLKAAGLSSKNYQIDLGIVRGLDYYTGMVYEIILTDKKEIGSVGGGGRYDNLIGYYKKDNVPGVGGSIGLSRLFAALSEESKDGQGCPADVMVTALSSDLLPYAFKVAATLRVTGINVFIYPKDGKIAKQLSYADKLGIPLVAVCGEEEEKKTKVTIKNLETGEQETVSLKQAAKFCKS